MYSESSVILTSIIRILDYPDRNITLHVTHGLCNYHTNAHTQYNYSLCIFSRTRVFFAWRWHVWAHACVFVQCCIWLYFTYPNFSLIRTKCLWHLTNGARITEDSLYIHIYIYVTICLRSERFTLNFIKTSASTSLLNSTPLTNSTVCLYTKPTQ